jgi:hypothetical protein
MPDIRPFADVIAADGDEVSFWRRVLPDPETAGEGG